MIKAVSSALGRRFNSRSASSAPATDPLFNNVTALLNMQGADESTVFTDSSNTGKTYTPFNGAKIDTTLGYPAGQFNGVNPNGSYLETTNDFAISPLNAEFCIEAYIYLTGYSSSYGGSFFGAISGKDQNSASGREYIFTLGGTATSWTTLRFVKFAGDTLNTVTVLLDGAFSFALNTLYHVAIRRSGNDYILSVSSGGVATDIASVNTAAASANTATAVRIGAIGFSGSEYYFPGYIVAFRMTKTTPRYSLGFVPDPFPFPTSS